MAGNTNREKILDDIVDALKDINGQWPYTTNFSRVEKGIFTLDQVGDKDFPFVCVVPPPDQFESFTHEAFRQLKVELPIAVIAYDRVPLSTPESEISKRRITIASEMQDDIIHALMQDIRRNGQASATKIVTSMSDEGDPDVTHSKGATVTLILRFNVRYFRTVDKTTE